MERREPNENRMPDIIAEQITDEERVEMERVVKEFRARPQEPFENEMQKDESHLRAIDEVNETLAELFELLSLDSPPKIRPDQVHVFSNDEIRRMAPEESSFALTLQPERIVIIDNDRTMGVSKALFYAAVLHESLHLFAYEKYQLTSDKEDLDLMRRGYLSINLHDQQHAHFTFVDEAIIQTIVIKNVMQRFGNGQIPQNELRQVLIEGSFGDAAYITSLIYNMSGRPQQEILDLWKGLFTGNLLSLRSIEKFYGPGSLRFLAALDDGLEEGLNQEMVNDSIREFFETESEETKDEIAKRLLNDREWRKYKKRKGL